ncbi:ABC transporter ATP-binding protein [Mycoplasmopsis mucosicanis]|uniref:ABC transporter ATP-binding protein n=1 Tax=Mycoplasmopsis mucosicanis TaxID=458208 RepID=A0A507SI26_9BACT|nr:ABC transporter ATP-binding protein [Mycoplasmopsis mucosicanis]TQC51529.1 ABC transporter ATP-binding protein [Mycoplasmopsis mucosicanis]
MRNKNDKKPRKFSKLGQNFQYEDKQFEDLRSLTTEYKVDTKIDKNNVFNIIDSTESRIIKAPRKICSYIARISKRRRKKDGNENAKIKPYNIIEVRDVSKCYVSGDSIIKVLKHVNIEIKRGEIVLILGVSGGGKSTLLNLISGLDKPTRGNIIINDINLPYYSDRFLNRFRRENVSFIFQNYNLLENLNAYDNVMTGAWLQKDPKRRVDLTELFRQYEMIDEINKFPSQMSGGQQQRVSIMRALSKNAPIIFADEPTGALDEKTTRIVLNSLYDANDKWGTTVIMVSHNPSMVAMCHRVIHIDKGVITKIDVNPAPLHPDEIGLYNE